MMASSDHLTTVDPWTLRPSSFLDPWFTDAISRDTETLTRALQVSLSAAYPSSAPAATPSDSNTNTNTNTNNSSSDTTTLTPDVVSPFLIPTPVLSAATFGSNSFENETAGRGVEAPSSTPKQRHRNGGAPGVSSGKVAKRKSRATKRSQTTFITADAENFRQLVQQVTGSRLGHIPVANIGQILRPEPQRPGNRFPGLSSRGIVSSKSSNASLASIAGCLPTLDTSAFLLDCPCNPDHHQQQHQGMVEMVGRGLDDLVAPPPLPVALAEELEPFESFPTLESWNTM